MQNEVRVKVLNKVFVLSEGENVIGRETGCVIALEGDLVSRRHAVITVSDGRAWLEDLGSCNGTYLNDKRLADRVEIRDGDRVRIAFYRLLVESVSVRTEMTPTVKLLYCTQCGAALNSRMKYCVQCGERIIEPLPQLSCGRCGTALVETVNYCMVCGLKVPKPQGDNEAERLPEDSARSEK